MNPEKLEQASCLDEDPDLFYPELDGHMMKALNTAKDICCECPIMKDCLQLALDTNEVYGVWGGATPAERSTMRRDPKMKVLHLEMMEKRATNGKSQSKKVN